MLALNSSISLAGSEEQINFSQRSPKILKMVSGSFIHALLLLLGLFLKISHWLPLCFRAVQAWKAHLLRSVNREDAKQNALTQIDEESSLIIMDWAMKYLPQHCLKSYIWVTYYYEAKASEIVLK